MFSTLLYRGLTVPWDYATESPVLSLWGTASGPNGTRWTSWSCLFWRGYFQLSGDSSQQLSRTCTSVNMGTTWGLRFQFGTSSFWRRTKERKCSYVLCFCQPEPSAGRCLQVEIIVEGDELLNAGSIRWVSLIWVPSGLPDTVVHIAGVF